MNLFGQFEEHFNSKNLDSLMSLFHDNVIGKELYSDNVDFNSRSELRQIYSSLFEINPNVRCSVSESLVSAEKYVAIVDYQGFVCGAKSKTVWNIKTEGGKIREILHLSENTPGPR